MPGSGIVHGMGRGNIALSGPVNVVTGSLWQDREKLAIQIQLSPKGSI